MSLWGYEQNVEGDPNFGFCPGEKYVKAGAYSVFFTYVGTIQKGGILGDVNYLQFFNNFTHETEEYSPLVAKETFLSSSYSGM